MRIGNNGFAPLIDKWWTMTARLEYLNTTTTDIYHDLLFNALGD
jgi:hypothetical protein